MSRCPTCKRPKTGDFLTGCFAEGGAWCEIAAAAYRRGLADGVALAKRTANAAVYGPEEIDWTETDNEAAKLAGEG